MPTIAPPATGYTEDSWILGAACAQHHDLNLWHSTGGWGSKKRMGEAMHICYSHCPVRGFCAEMIGPMPSAVVAGTAYNEAGLPFDVQPATYACDQCRKGTS